MIKKTNSETYAVSPYGDGCMTCCTANSATGTSSSHKPKSGC